MSDFKLSPINALHNKALASDKMVMLLTQGSADPADTSEISSALADSLGGLDQLSLVSVTAGSIAPGVTADGVSGASNSGKGVVGNSVSSNGGAFFSNSAVALIGYSQSQNGANISSATGAGAAIYSEGSEVGAYLHSEGGPGSFSYSGDGAGAVSVSYSGTYHHLFGDPAQAIQKDRAFVEVVDGAFGWFRGSFTGKIKADATLTANRLYTLPDADGVVAVVPSYASKAAGNAAVAVGEVFYAADVKKVCTRLS